jgi:hypothetical protein
MLTRLAEESLIRAYTIASFPGPDLAYLKHIRGFLTSQKMRMKLHGLDRNIWGTTDFPDSYARDLMALHAQGTEDFLYTWIRNKVIKKFFRCVGHCFKTADPILGIEVYENSTIRNVARVMTTLIASTLLIASITILNAIASMGARLGAIAAFTVAFGLCLACLGKCKPSDIFAITSAYDTSKVQIFGTLLTNISFSAVQVVFIGNNNNCPGSTTRHH